MQKNDEFRQINGNLTGLRASAVFHTLEKLIADNAKCIRPLAITKSNNTNHPAFYIKDKASAKHNPFANLGYQLSESHLTLEKYFRENTSTKHHGLSIAHSTQSYTHSNSQQIIVHTYFNRHADVDYIEVKKYEVPNQESPFVKLQLNSYQEALIRENAISASEILKRITAENEALYKEAFKLANTYEDQLKMVSLRLGKNTINEYISIAKKCIDAIHLINRYSDNFVDKRDKLLEQQVKKLQQLVAISFDPEPIESSNTTNTDSPQRNAEISPIITTPQPNKKTQHYQEILLLKRQLDAIQIRLKAGKNVGLVLDQADLIKEIEVQMLYISKFSSSLSKKERALLNNLSNSLTSEDLVALFKAELCKGNLETVKQIYPYVQYKVDTEFLITSILVPLLCEKIPENAVQEEQMTTILDFLNENSETYQRLTSNTASPLVNADNSDQLASLLFLALVNNNFFAFKTLLRQGVNPNFPALIKTGLNGYDHQFSILHFSLFEDTKYLKLLVEHGARIDTCRIKFIPTQYNNIQVKLRNESKNVFLKNPLREHGANSPSLIDLAFSLKKYQVLEILSPQLQFIDLITLFAKLTSDGVLTRQVYLTNVKASGISLVDTSSIQDVIHQSISDLPTNCYLVFILLLEAPLELQHLLKTLVEKLKKDHDALDPESIEKIYNELLNSGNKHAKTPKQGLEALYYFTSCIYLLVLSLDAYPEKTFMTQQKIIQLYCKVAMLYQKSLSEEGKNDAPRYFKHAVDIAKSSTYYNELSETPIYTFCLDKIMELQDSENDNQTSVTLSTI